MDCAHHNLQIQKNQYIHDIVKAVDCRIKEIKNELNKLEGSNYRFPHNGLQDFALTPCNIELVHIPEKAEVSEEVKILIEETKQKIIEEMERKEEAEEEAGEEITQWWDNDNATDSEDKTQIYEVEQKESDETLERRHLLSMIAAQEKARQVTRQVKLRRLKRQMWEKELKGETNTPATLETRARAANMIQKYCRKYFELKRKKVADCKRDELLGLRICKKREKTAMEHSLQVSAKRMKLRAQYEIEYKEDCEKIKNAFEKKRGREIVEDYRDEIRDWFRQWYKKMNFFYDIPKDNQGGSTLILNGTVPTPEEYNTFYQTVVDKRKKNKDKSASELKNEKKQAKIEAIMKKKEAAMKKKFEEKFLKKTMKNPSTHPGYMFPKSERIENVLSSIEEYHKRWDDLDELNTMDVKEKYVKFIEEEKAFTEVKMELRPTVDDVMRKELKKLKDAMERDYEYMEKELPEVMIAEFPRITRKKKKVKKEKKLMDIGDAMKHLIVKEIIKEYPRTTFDDFKGEANVIGDDIRCNLQQAVPHAAEIKAIWWEQCSELIRGLNKILLIGPLGSGKTTLVHIMATINDATLFEVDLKEYADEELTAVVAKTADALATCARASQPCVIYFKHIQRLFYGKKKMPPNEAKLNDSLLRKHLIKKLFKQFQKHDKVTIVGGCADPWLTQSGALLKSFPNVILTPNTHYSTTFEILREWVLSNRMVPPDLDIDTLAYTLQGYSYEYLKESLKSFLTAERIVRMAAKGLTTQEVFDHVIDDPTEQKTDYEKYLNWYTDKTQWGKIEKKHIKEQLEYQELAKKYEEQAKKNKKKGLGSEAGSVASTIA
ncbi:IQ and AAA domain-containing protein 1-like isoform X2 [Hyposmocoma kahamanoa]|uniref:IQ and AAA domain-containing protein 1-like isoform X2 n=1 Tax=Hyposmocoma kahamanoa TaxID=1477025 RepID=UPI000E6D6483|nr:IQ and AAA domain-containing protein 1-like isoform X2 [Hyposmocoma kahamanoa]